MKITTKMLERSFSLVVMIPLSIIALVARGVTALALRPDARRNPPQRQRRPDIEDAVRRQMQRGF